MDNGHVDLDEERVKKELRKIKIRSVAKEEEILINTCNFRLGC